MGPWVIPAISAAGSALQSYLASRKQKQGYEMSPYEQMLYGAMQKEYESGEVPGHVTDPFVRGAKGIEQYYRRKPGSSARQHGVLQREIYTPMAEAGGRYRRDLRGEMASLVRGTGTQWTQQPPDIGMPLSDIGWALAMANAGKPGSVGGGGGMQYGQGSLGLPPRSNYGIDPFGYTQRRW